MARDNHPRTRQANKLARRQGKRATADRILVVSEGSKTEPEYFEEIRKSLRLPTANVHVMPSEYGTPPDQVVQFAKDLFLKGNEHLKIKPKAFEKVYAVFDRDDHDRYHNALSQSQIITRTNLRNDLNKKIEFKGRYQNTRRVKVATTNKQEIK